MNDSAKMRAMAWPARGPSARPQAVELDSPEPGPGAVRVRVVASAVNPADLRVTRGELVGRILHASTKPLVVGYDFSGTVDRCGDGVADLAPGDDVFGFLPYAPGTRQGAFAEFIAAGRTALARKPPAVPHEIAAAAATPAITALQCLRDLGRLPPSGRVMIVGAAGGVGSLAVGIARRLGAEVVAVCSGYAAEFVRGLGANEVVDRRTRDPLTVAGPFDVVLDAASAYGYFACKHLLGPRGRYVATLPSPGILLGMLAASFSERKCAFIEVKPVAADLALIAEWLADGLTVPIDSRFPVRDVAEGLDRLARGEMRGRIAIAVAGGF